MQQLPQRLRDYKTRLIIRLVDNKLVEIKLVEIKLGKIRQLRLSGRFPADSLGGKDLIIKIGIENITLRKIAHRQAPFICINSKNSVKTSKNLKI